MLSFLRIRTLMLFLLSVAVCSNSFASGSGAFRVETPDAGAAGKGTSFVGEANTPAAIYYNPAGLTQIKQSEVSAGFSYIAPEVDYKNSSGDSTQMRRNTFTIPHAYVVVPIAEKLTLGFGATSYFGLGTEWAEDSFSKYVATKSEIENKNIMITTAFQVNEQLSIGVSADNDDTKASKNKKLAQASGTDGNFQLKAKDNAWGYRLATMFKVNEQHQFGLMYRSRIKHKYEGKAYMDGLDTSLTVGPGALSYQTAFGDASYETKFTEKFTLPQSVVLGYSFKPSKKWTFNVDVEWMDWSSVKREAINWTEETNATRLAILNDGNPANRDWKSVWSQSVGAEYAVNDQFRLRTGYYHHASPIPQGNWEPSLPDSNSHGVSAGFGYDVTKSLTLDLAYQALFYEPRKIDNTVGSASGASIDGTYNQFMNIGYMTLTYKY